MFKIGEFSKLTMVSIRMLRYYDEQGLLSPARIDENGYRLYDVKQIETLQKIVMLRDAQFQVAEIKQILASDKSEDMVDYLNKKEKEIAEEIIQKQKIIQKIQWMKQDINSEHYSDHYKVTFKSIPSYPILSYRATVPSYFDEGSMWEKMAEFMKKEHVEVVNSTYNNLSIYYDTEYREKDYDIEIAVVVKKKKDDKDGFLYRNSEPVELMACVMVYGPFSNISKAYYSFALWLDKHPEYQMDGCTRQISHKGPDNESNPDNYLTEVQIPVKKQV